MRDYFEQFTGDELIDYAPLVKRLVHNPTGDTMPYDDGVNFYDQACLLWMQMGSPPIMIRSFIQSLVVESWAYGKLVNQQWG